MFFWTFIGLHVIMIIWVLLKNEKTSSSLSVTNALTEQVHRQCATLCHEQPSMHFFPFFIFVIFTVSSKFFRMICHEILENIPIYRTTIDNGISDCRISPFSSPLATVFMCSRNPDAVIRLPNSGQFSISEPDPIKQQHYPKPKLRTLPQELCFKICHCLGTKDMHRGCNLFW